MNRYNNIKIELAEKDKICTAPSKIQVLRCGKFKSPFYGEFEINDLILREMKRNYDQNVRGIDLAVDFEHERQSIAAGWIKNVELQNQDTELWCEIDWTERGKDAVEKKLYRYLSAEYDTAYEDNETGQKHGNCLLGAALTNRPFVKRMSPTTELEEKKMEKQLKELQEVNANLLSEKEKLVNENKVLSEKIVNSEKEIAELKKSIQLKDKEAEYSALLSEGKVTVAQKEAFLKGDLAEFLKVAPKKEITLEEVGSSEVPTEQENWEKELDEKIDAEIAKTNCDYGTALRKVLSENEKLNKEFLKKY